LVPNSPEFIVVHHSLTKDSGTVSWDAIRAYHKSLGWKDIGYHWGIERVGGDLVVMVGRSESEIGAHTKELHMNSRSVGICVVGNYDLGKPPTGYIYLLLDLCKRIMKDYSIPTENVIGHREVGMMAGYNWQNGEFKSCPGSQFDMAALRNLIGRRDDVL
jgi:N-acetylmuramoyl-L-alanine amidase